MRWLVSRPDCCAATHDPAGVQPTAASTHAHTSSFVRCICRNSIPDRTRPVVASGAVCAIASQENAQHAARTGMVTAHVCFLYTVKERAEQNEEDDCRTVVGQHPAPCIG